MIELSFVNAAVVTPGDQPGSLATDALHIWRWTSVDCDELWLEHLDERERDRHQRFITAELRQRFLAAHGGQRKVLASYLQCDPSDLRFDYEAKGKPFIPGRPLEFNLSHSDQECVLAVGTQRVGVDIECSRPVGNVQGLAAKHFTTNEQLEVGALDDDAALGYFLQIWTRKEAVVKVTGLGLGASVHALEVMAVSHDFSELELPNQWKTDLEVCWLADLSVSAASYAAVATASKPSEVHCFAWNHK